MTLREIIYMIMDELKLMSDDSYFNEDHIKFLVSKYRVYLLNQLYKKDITSKPSDSNYQLISVLLETTPEEDDSLYFSNKDFYVKSTDSIPNILEISNTKIYPESSKFGTNFSLVSNDRMKFVGYNKWMKNIIYCTIDNNKLYAYTYSNDIDTSKSFKINIKGIFEDAEAAHMGTNDFMDIEYPLENSLIPALIQSVVAELAPKTITPEDSTNNATDDKSNIHNYIARNLKQNAQ